MLHTGAGNTYAVDLLKRIIADQRRRHLTREDDKRNGIHVCGGDTSDRVGGTGPGRDQHNTRFSRGARISVRRVRGRLFMPHQNMFDLVLLIQRIVDVQYRTAGITEHVLDPLVGETAYKDISASQLHLFVSRVLPKTVKPEKKPVYRADAQSAGFRTGRYCH